MANRYWVGGQASSGSVQWDNTQNWSASSGGAPGASVPTSIDDVYFDDVTKVSGRTIEPTANAACNNFYESFTNSSVSSLGYDNGYELFVHGDTISRSSNARLRIPIRILNSCELFHTGTYGQPITKITVAGGTTTAMSDYTIASATVKAGATLDFNGLRFSQGSTSIIAEANSTIDMTNAYISLGGSFSFDPSATVYASGSSIPQAKEFHGGGHTFNSVQSSGSLQIFGSNTFNQLTLTNPYDFVTDTHTFEAGTTQVIGTLVTNSNPTKLRSSIDGVPFTLSKSSGTVTVNGSDIKDSTVTGGATWYASGSVDSGNNTGWIFNTPPTATLNSPADNVSLTTTTPTLAFTATDPEGDDVEYQVQVGNADFSTLHMDVTTATFASGTQQTRVVSPALTQGGIDYYWRVRGKDPLGTNMWGPWSTVRSFNTNIPSTLMRRLVKSKSGGVWIERKVWVKQGGVWVPRPTNIIDS